MRLSLCRAAFVALVSILTGCPPTVYRAVAARPWAQSEQRMVEALGASPPVEPVYGFIVFRYSLRDRVADACRGWLSYASDDSSARSFLWPVSPASDEEIRNAIQTIRSPEDEIRACRLISYASRPAQSLYDQYRRTGCDGTDDWGSGPVLIAATREPHGLTLSLSCDRWTYVDLSGLSQEALRNYVEQWASFVSEANASDLDEQVGMVRFRAAVHRRLEAFGRAAGFDLKRAAKYLSEPGIGP